MRRLAEEDALRRHVEVARSKVGPPSMGLMGAALLQAMTALLYLVGGLALSGALFASVQSNPSSTSPTLDWAVPLIMGASALVFAVIGVIPPLVFLFGALQMRRMRSYGWAMTVTISLPVWGLVQLGFMGMTMSLACVLALPSLLLSFSMAIWALVVLQDLRIYQAFQDARELGVDH